MKSLTLKEYAKRINPPIRGSIEISAKLAKKIEKGINPPIRGSIVKRWREELRQIFFGINPPIRGSIVAYAMKNNIK